ncbi:hypothetical protein D3C85_853720 [compost metagenome]
MPQAAQEHGQEQVAVGVEGALAVAAQRHVQVVAQPGRQADVPAPPELGDRLADIGLVEVFHEAETHHQAQADGHVAVAGEVEIQLRGVGEHAQPGIAGAGVLQGEEVVDQRCQAVGDEHLLDEALHEAGGAFAELVEAVAAVGELLGEILVAQHRPGNQLREQGDEGGEVDQVFRGFGVAAVHVDQVAERLENIEGDADRQDHVGQQERLEAGAFEHLVDVRHAEVGVLEVTQGRQVAGHAPDHPALRRLAAYSGAVDAQAETVVPQGDRDEQQEEIHPPPGVEHVAADQDQQVAIAITAHVIQAEKDRQEQEQEYVG